MVELIEISDCLKAFKLMDVNSSFFEIDQNKLNYTIVGKGYPVLLLHGWPQTPYMWRHLYPYLIKNNFCVIMPDVPGLGNSFYPISYDKKTIASYLQRLVHDHLNFDQIYIVGHDWGGPIAYSYARTSHNKVKKIVLIDVLVPGDGTSDFSSNRWHHQFHKINTFPEELTKGREKLYLKYFYENWSGKEFTMEKDAQDKYLKAYTNEEIMKSGFEYYRALPQDIDDNIEFLKKGKLHTPFLGIAGKDGYGRGIEIILNSLNRITNNFEGYEISSAGHWVAEEEPELAAKYILEFFNKN